MRVKRLATAALCLLCSMLLTGSIFRSAEIVTYNGEPLIDLDALIHSTELGQEGSTDDGNLADPVKPGNSDDNTANNNEKQNEKNPDKRYVIEVSDNVITCPGGTYVYLHDKKAVIARNSAKNLEDVLKEASGKEIVLSDNYAEAHAYRFMIEYVKKALGESVALTLEPDYGSSWGVVR